MRETRKERSDLENGQDNRVENIWAGMKGICIRETEELVGRSSEYGVNTGEKWWWNGDVQEAVKQ